MVQQLRMAHDPRHDLQVEKVRTLRHAPSKEGLRELMSRVRIAYMLLFEPQRRNQTKAKSGNPMAPLANSLRTIIMIMIVELLPFFFEAPWSIPELVQTIFNLLAS